MSLYIGDPQFTPTGYYNGGKILPGPLQLEKMRWSGVTGFYHPDDINSTVPIACMKSNPNIMTIMALKCTPNQAWKDQQERLGLKTVVTADKKIIELTDSNGEIIPIVVDDKQENLAPLVILAGLAALLFMGG